LRLPGRKSIFHPAMQFDYDAVIIGGAFSGAATGLMIKRRNPSARVLIIEKNAAFDRKVGESTTEVSSCFLTRILGLANYLGHEQLAKQGLRMWFCNSPEQRFDECVEIGPRYSARVQTFQVDRAKLDSHLLECAVNAGCDLWRPAKVTKIELNGEDGQSVTVDLGNGGRCAVGAENKSDTTERVPPGRTVRARWLIDASGRATLLARKLGHFRPNNEHPINAVWARFTGVKDWDSYDWREKFRGYMDACRTARSWATNHLMGHGWWCWIIPLRGGDVSAGIVYDSRIFQLPNGGSIAERLHAHILANPVGREIFRDARAIEGDVHAFSSLPYYTERVCDDGWACVGDAAGFIDPLYSPGLDFCSYTSNYVADFVATNIAGEDVTAQVKHYREQYPVMYRSWFETLYKDKYYYMGDAELMSAGFLLDVASYYFGLVIPAYRDPEKAFLELPFQGRPGRIAAGAIKFYNRRLVALAKRRLATGRFARNNAGWRELYDGFVPDFRVTKLLRKGLLRWWKAELTNLRLMFVSRAATPVKHSSTVTPAEA
jgi:flavin-dependent dehydrogenase